MKSILRSIQNSLWWIFPMFIAVTGMLLWGYGHIPVRLIASTTIFTGVLIGLITWIASVLIYEKDPTAKFILGREAVEFRKKEPFALIFLLAIFGIGGQLLPWAIYMSFVGGKVSFLYFGYSVGGSVWFASILLLFRYWKAEKEEGPEELTNEERINRAIHG